MKRKILKRGDKLFTKAWRPYFTVALAVRGGFKPDILPFVEYIVGHNSDSSGTWMDGSGLWDADWYRDGRRTARRVFLKLENLFRSVRVPYVDLRLLHYHTEAKRPKVIAGFHRGKLKPVRRRAA